MSLRPCRGFTRKSAQLCHYLRGLQWRKRIFSQCSHEEILTGDTKHKRKSSLMTKNGEATLYVHWPYCKQICTFCNFNKYKSKHVDHQRMRECLLRETETLLQLSGVKRINSVYFGGGTPSLAEPLTIFSVLDTVAKYCFLPSDAEVTLEANPSSVETDSLRHFQSAGINRLSLGVQTFNSRDLSILGRDNTVKESFSAIEIGKQLFPGKVSVDLMFGRPLQTVEMWLSELAQALSVVDDHISLYQLTLERGTPLYKDVNSRKISVPDSDTVAEMYEVATAILANSGFHRYEVANFAKPGAESRHNLSYWNGTQYIGVGPGAHGRFIPRSNGTGTQLQARVQTLEPNCWMKEVETRGHGTRKEASLGKYERMEEIFMLSLRTARGLTNERWQTLSSHVGKDTPLQDLFGNSRDVQILIESGLVSLDQKGLRATQRGLSVIDSIMQTLLLHLEQMMTTIELDQL